MIVSLVILGLTLALFGVAAPTLAQTSGPRSESPERGLVSESQETAAVKDVCKNKKLKGLPKSKKCTHGPDPAPPGVDITKSVSPIAPVAQRAALVCDGDGVSGFRTQVIYAHASDVSDRYNTYLASFRQWASDADQIYYDSAIESGGAGRHIRFVQDAGCNPTIPDVTLSPTGDDNIDNTINELQAQGYNRSDRKYMIFVDATIICGQGTVQNDDQPGAANANNSGVSYGRTDAGCWGGEVPAHELMHNLGGVQLSAPHASGGWHCIDEWDIMCYSDPPYFPTMQILCPDSTHDRLLDCNHDDYYSTNPPPNSYLATHWDAANNQFLIGGTSGDPCVSNDDAYEPDGTAGQSHGFSVGSTENHKFCHASDQDWISFQATAGTPYRIETLNLASGTDTMLDLYQSDAVTLIASNDDNGSTLASLITFTPTASGRYYVKAHQYGDSGSPNYTYQLHIAGQSDTTPPTVSWVSPVTSEGQTYTAASGTVNIEASATDSSGIARVRFYRWDAINGVYVDIATITAPRYRTSVNVGTLNMGYNEIDADVVDNAGNIANTYFWIYRSSLPNQLSNPSFELDANNDSRPDSWTSDSKFTRSNATTPVDGSFVGRFYGTANSGVTIKQTVNATAGTTYNFSCSAKIPAQNDTTFKLQFQVQWLKASNSVIKTWTMKTYSANTANAWNQATGSQAAPSGTTKAVIIMKASSLNGTIYVDNCVFR